ncbi:hypothetical protein, partial [Gemmatimonas sp.]|uniref:hypothetical protein n=1 Tax=Gemmatimonas sp. TaxID=1962908 RepID=UPI0035674EB2
MTFPGIAPVSRISPGILPLTGHLTIAHHAELRRIVDVVKIGVQLPEIEWEVPFPELIAMAQAAEAA